MGLRRTTAVHPLATAFVFEALLVPLALGLALVLGLSPWAELGASAGTLLVAVAATLPLLVLLAVFTAVPTDWFREVETLVGPLVEMLFRGRGVGAVVLLSALAGLGEELLFRGVLQAWLAGMTGPWTAVVLGGVVFGLAHYLSRAYFVLATCMGLYLGALYQLSGNLLLPVLVHALYDAIAIAYLLHRRERRRT